MTRLQDGLDPVGIVDDYVDGAGITDNNLLTSLICHPPQTTEGSSSAATGDGGRIQSEQRPQLGLALRVGANTGEGSTAESGLRRRRRRRRRNRRKQLWPCIGGDASLSTVIDGVSSAGGGVVVEGMTYLQQQQQLSSDIADGAAARGRRWCRRRGDDVAATSVAATATVVGTTAVGAAAGGRWQRHQGDARRRRT